MKNIVELRNELLKVYAGLKSNKLNLLKANAMNNTSSKIMQSVSLEMKREYQTGRKRNIDFIDNGIQYHAIPSQPKAKSKASKRK